MAGRPKHEVTEASRRVVSVGLAVGLREEDLCAILLISRPTLRKHYRGELKFGFAQLNLQVAATAFKMATSGTSPAMTAFWLKCRAGWREARPEDTAVVPEEIQLDDNTAAKRALEDRITSLGSRFQSELETTESNG